jgi:hypothetical protein
MNCFSSSCVPKLPVSLDCTFLIAPSVFSNIYLNTSGRRYIYKSSPSCFLKSGWRCSSVTHYVSGVYPIKNSAWLPPWITHKSPTCKYNKKWLNIIFSTKHKLLPEKIGTQIYIYYDYTHKI